MSALASRPAAERTHPATRGAFVVHRSVGYIALLCAGILLLLHIGTVLGVRPSWGMTLVGCTLPVLFVVALTYIIASNRFDLRKRPPLWALLVWTAVTVYGGFNFDVVHRATGGAYILQTEGEPALGVHGQVARRLSPAEGEALRTWELRGLTGHLILFFVLTGVGLLVLAPREDRGQRFDAHVG